MDPPAGKIILNGAPSQYDRWLPALDPGYAKVDGRSFSDLLDFPVKYGALINFYDLRNEIDGDWVGFFASDPTMMLAVLESMDVGALEHEYARLDELTRAAHVFNRKFERLCRLFAFIQGLARQINDALVALGHHPDRGVARALEQVLANAIVLSLGPQLRLLKEYAEGAGLPRALDQPIPLDWNGFLSLWGLRDDCPDGSIYRGHSRVEKINHALPHLSPIFAAFRDSFADFKRFALVNFEASLKEPDHKPQIGLYIAFARLFVTAQDTLNTISSRYIDFYYRDMLREKPAGPVGDRVFLAFTLAEDEAVKSAPVPRGTAFPAGQDADGQDIIYGSEKDLQVAAARIDTVRTLRRVRGQLATDRPDASTHVDRPVTKYILGSDIAMADAAAKSIPWSTFGVAEPRLSPVEITGPATLGFGLASPYLMLSGGDRDLKVLVRYSGAFKSEILEPLLGEISDIVGLPRDEVLRIVLESAFTVLASNADGWFETPPYRVELPQYDTPTFGLHIELKSEAPPIAAYDPSAVPPPADDPRAAVNPVPDLPTLKLYLRQQAVTLMPPPDGAGRSLDVYPLSLLDGMPIETLRVCQHVTGLTNLELECTTGPLDESAPFTLFGAPPVVGSYLDIRHSELFSKRIETLGVTIDWFDLPANTGGFKGYYRDYVIGLDGLKHPDLFYNAVFLNSIGVQNPGAWSIYPKYREKLFLFRTSDDPERPPGSICPATKFFFPQWMIEPETPPQYYAPADGAIRLTLTAPVYAFGEDLYTQNVLYAVISDLPDPVTCRERCESKYVVLADAAKMIGACIDECSLEPDPTFKACITACMNRVADQLLIDVIQCLWDCAIASQRRLTEDIFGHMKASFDAASAAPRDQRARSLREWAEAWRAPASLDAGCLDKCFSLIGAILGIEICLGMCAPEPVETYRACVLPCLRSCQVRLEQSYAGFVETCIVECAKPKSELNYPNAPWLPTAQRVTVDYRADGLVFGDGAPDGVFFHLLPFGGYQRVAVAPATLLPVFDEEGYLYLGFNGLAPPQSLTLLFQMASTGGWTGGHRAGLAFDVLARGGWNRLNPTAVIADSTNGLDNSGILGLSLPAYDPVGSTVIAGDSQWLCVRVADGAALYPDTICIYPNATVAHWLDEPGTGSSLDRPLPAGTILSSVQPLPYIESIIQPMESFGGRPAEDRREFEMRLGERLRHKNRAVAAWDYERLVLARFPTIWKVQALPVRNGLGGNAPGDVLVVVVGGPDTLDVADPTMPVASGTMLGAIREYLEGLTSPFVGLQVVNAIYVRITVVAIVQFSAADDVGAAILRLNDELVRYLSPWFYDAARAAKGGRYADADEIEAFVENQPGVDALLDFDVTYDPPTDDLDWYFLTSAKQHDIVSAGVAVAQSMEVSAN